MIKGHAKIELKNVNTGKVRVIEHDNLITNALSKQFNVIAPIYDHNAIRNEYLPFHEKGMGGIVLFQNVLDESADNMCMPDEAVNPIIGYASNEVSPDTDTKRGSRNLTESSELANGYKFVYDFATDQGNGEISALALTHNGAGKNPKGSDLIGNGYRYQIVNDVTHMHYLFSALTFDWATEILTCVLTTSTTTISIRKYKLCIGQSGIGVNDSLMSAKLLSEETSTFSSTINDKTIWVNGEDGYFYGIYISGKTGKIVRINASNYTLDENYSFNIQFTTNSYDVNLSLYPGYNRGAICIHDGYLYNVRDSKGFKIKLSDGSVNEYKLTSSVGWTPSLTYHNGLFHVNRYLMTKDFVLSTRKTGNHSEDFFSNSNTGTMEREVVFLRDDGSGISLTGQNNSVMLVVGNTRDYLATINNLDAPVTKTSQDVMKITYTITEV